MSAKTKKKVKGRTYDGIIKELKSLRNPKNIEGMARYGLNSPSTLGICMPDLMRIAKETGKDHELALRLWESGIYDARILAFMIDDWRLVTEQQMEHWAKGFDNWGIVDGCCGHLFDRTPFAYKKAIEWSKRKEEFVKRAAYTMMATLTVHDKKAEDEKMLRFLPLIVKGATDERRYVSKSVNWALRQIGKRNHALNEKAIETAERIKKLDSKAARWIASDALRELKGEAVQKRLLKQP
ncbi:MAG: DNA alkylation repair protein [Thermoplasmatota archaeon]|nr:DNA alkylation repair protein [Candidatus Thermoplasmatota archaeon]MBU1914181.1 DNA alkylation repair protein [Candidatus Thermoplasmatota archaeon]